MAHGSGARRMEEHLPLGGLVFLTFLNALLSIPFIPLFPFSGTSPAEMQLSLLVMEEAREALQAASGLSLIFSWSLDQISSAEGSGQAGTCSATDAEVFSNGLFASMQPSDSLRIPKGPLWRKGNIFNIFLLACKFQEKKKDQIVTARKKNTMEKVWQGICVGNMENATGLARAQLRRAPEQHHPR